MLFDSDIENKLSLNHVCTFTGNKHIRYIPACLLSNVSQIEGYVRKKRRKIKEQYRKWQYKYWFLSELWKMTNLVFYDKIKIKIKNDHPLTDWLICWNGNPICDIKPPPTLRRKKSYLDLDKISKIVLSFNYEMALISDEWDFITLITIHDFMVQ